MIMGAWGMGRKSGWRNPYVTDGLIALWDGEWNAGGGVHDPNASRLVNLCGGAPIVLSQGAVVGAKSITYNTTAADDCGGITENMDELPLPGEMTTTEAVWQSTKGTTWSDYRLSFVFRNGRAGYYNNRLLVGMGYYRNNATTFRCGDKYTANITLSSLCSTTNQSRAWNDQTGYLDMTPLTTSQQRSTGFVDDARVRILTSTVANAEIEFACLRIYNRSLTDAEIAANYAIDKQRFNLP